MSWIYTTRREVRFIVPGSTVELLELEFKFAHKEGNEYVARGHGTPDGITFLFQRDIAGGVPQLGWYGLRIKEQGATQVALSASLKVVKAKIDTPLGAIKALRGTHVVSTGYAYEYAPSGQSVESLLRIQ